MTSIKEWQVAAHDLAVEKGFYDGRTENDPVWDACRLMKIVGEVAEAYEEIKVGKEPSLYWRGTHAVVDGLAVYKPECYGKEVQASLKPVGLGPELADVLLFVFDFAESKGIDLEQMLEIKHNFNKSRARMHGKVL